MNLSLFKCELPIRTVSEANTREHWAIARKRHVLQKWCVKSKFLSEKPKITLPCIIKLTRLASRKLDDDNLQSAFKYIRDQIADCIFPGKKAGQADNDPKIKWEYYQSRGEGSILIEIIYPMT